MSKTVAIAGAGNVAKFLVEELKKAGHNKIIVLSRAVCYFSLYLLGTYCAVKPRDWFVKAGVDLRITDYTTNSILSHIQDADVLVSLLHDNSSFYNEAHVAMLEACKLSPKCKHFIPSEMVCPHFSAQSHLLCTTGWRYRAVSSTPTVLCSHTWSYPPSVRAAERDNLYPFQYRVVYGLLRS